MLIKLEKCDKMGKRSINTSKLVGGKCSGKGKKPHHRRGKR